MKVSYIMLIVWQIHCIVVKFGTGADLISFNYTNFSQWATTTGVNNKPRIETRGDIISAEGGNVSLFMYNLSVHESSATLTSTSPNISNTALSLTSTSPNIANTASSLTSTSPNIANTASSSSTEISVNRFTASKVTSSLTAAGSTQSEMIRDESSCKDKCGQIQQLPCSCDVKCLVYNNCCEDMSLVCPEVLQESRIRYGHMLDMKVECTPENVFVITDCGSKSTVTIPTTISDMKDAINGTTATISTSTKITSFDNIQPRTSNTTRPICPDNKYDIFHQFLQLIDTSYVTDTQTGFVYKNMNIYSCAAAKISKTFMWYVTFSTSIDYPTTFRSVIRQLKEKSSYVLPSELETTEAHCLYSAKTCDTNGKSVDRDTTFLSRCKQFISYVISGNILFNNRYCAMCVFKNPVTSPITRYTQDTDWIIKVGLIESGKYVRIIRNEKYLEGAWLEARCKIPTLNPEISCSMDDHCIVDKCSINAFRRSDGDCKYLHVLNIAVSDDGYPLSVDEQNVLPEFISCFLKSYVGLDIDDDVTTTETLFERRLNKVLYVTKMYVYESYRKLASSKSKLSETTLIQGISLMSKSIKAYRKLRLNVTHRFDVIGTTKLTMKSHRLNDFVPVENRTITDERDVTIACLCSVVNVYINRLVPMPCPVSCIQDPMYKGDNEAITAYLNSTCFLNFDYKTNCKQNTSVSRILFLSMFLVFIDFIYN